MLFRSDKPALVRNTREGRKGGQVRSVWPLGVYRDLFTAFSPFRDFCVSLSLSSLCMCVCVCVRSCFIDLVGTKCIHKYGNVEKLDLVGLFCWNS